MPGVHPVIRGKTLFEYQQNLPSLPIPTLEDTLDRWKQSLLPLLADDSNGLKQAMAAVEEFRMNDGPRLQQMLLDLQQKTGKEQQWPHSHWLEKYVTRCRSFPLFLFIPLVYSFRFSLFLLLSLLSLHTLLSLSLSLSRSLLSLSLIQNMGHTRVSL